MDKFMRGIDLEFSFLYCVYSLVFYFVFDIQVVSFIPRRPLTVLSIYTEITDFHIFISHFRKCPEFPYYL